MRVFMIEIPLGLRNAIESGECVLFLGAGIGNHLKDKNGNTAPDASTLALELATNFSIDIEESIELSKISELIELRIGRKELEAFLRKRFANLEPDDDLQWLFKLRWRAIYTTNYDNGIQRAYELLKSPPQNPKTIVTSSEYTRVDPIFEVPVYHLHGALYGYSKPNIIITESDYSKFREQRRMLFELLKIEFTASSILYIGYSNSDPNWKNILSEISSEFSPSPMPQSYRVSPDTNQIDIEILKAKNIETIKSNYLEFTKALSITLSEIQIDSKRLKQIKSTVPSDLIEAFEKEPAAIARLLSSWIYVNQTSFNETPNIRSFLRGDLANWSLIGGKHHFERDIEEEIYNTLLDYATSTSKKPMVNIILAPAGYGITTLLMSLAAHLVNERAGPVFMLKPGASFLEGDIDYAVSLFKERPFFYIDNSADNVEALQSAIQRLAETSKTAMFVLGERLNEWRQSRNKIRGQEFEIQPLSDPEIFRLLDCLEKNAELNQLKHLSKDLQFAAIKVNYNKELLVAMREATEGKSFDAILEDEYRGIGNELSRMLYLIVCCFHQHGALIRDNLAAQLLGVSLIELFEKTKEETEGVLFYECIDEYKGSYQIRSRHRIIAAVVWERCGNPIDREDILHLVLGSLNLNYKSDKESFFYFIKSDRMVDSIRTLDGKIKFFDIACQKDPISPYVRQHYARMLSRSNKAELALSQIDEAIRLNPQGRIFFHTKGVILSQLAFSIESQDLARRRMAQSESAYRQALSFYPKDEYSFQGLAQLYIGWAKRVESPEEASEYISRAEAVITEGLKVVNVRDGLWIESSNIQRLLGDYPQHIKELENAVKASPGSVIARYLLGRTYRKNGQYQDAIDVLTPNIKNYHDEFRSFVEYALSLVHLNKPYQKAIAILKLSTLYGLGDPRFIATLGGLLFLDKKFSEAENVFSESSKRQFTAKELNSTQFYPPDPLNPDLPLRLKGKVIIVKAGYALIEPQEYPKAILCPGSKFEGIIMEVGLELIFEPAFTAKGPIANNIKTINGH